MYWLKEKLSVVSRWISPSSYYKTNIWSQCGEDKITAFALTAMGKCDNYRYLDIGAHHPYYLSNTSYFYSKKGSGVLIEPDPELAGYLAKMRPRDVVLNIGIKDKNEQSNQLKFYIMDVKTLNTFSEDEVHNYEMQGHKVIGTKNIDVVEVNTILEQHFKTGIDLLSVDVEGFDYEVIRSINFSICRPKVIVAETISYAKSGEPKKDERIMEFLKNNNYLMFADTYVNTIFVDKDPWINR